MARLRVVVFVNDSQYLILVWWREFQDESVKRYGVVFLAGLVGVWLFLMIPPDSELSVSESPFVAVDAGDPPLLEVVDIADSGSSSLNADESLESDDSDILTVVDSEVSESDPVEGELLSASSASLWLYPEDHAPRLIQIEAPFPGKVAGTGCEYGRNTAWRAVREKRDEPWATEMEVMLKSLWDEQKRTPVDSSLMIYCGSTVCQISHAYTENGYPHQYMGPYLNRFRDSPLASEFFIKSLGGMDRRQMLLLRRSGAGLQEGEPEHCVESGGDLPG